MLEQRVTLRDGDRVLIRPLKPDDASLYPDFLSQVTANDLRLRFFAWMREVRPELLDKLSITIPNTLWPSLPLLNRVADCSEWYAYTMTRMAPEPNSRFWSAPTSKVTGLAG